MNDEDKKLIRVADSGNDNCIRSLTHLLGYQYPGVVFDMYIGHTCIVSIVDGDAFQAMLEANPTIVNDITSFANGYTIGFEAGIDECYTR